MNLGDGLLFELENGKPKLILLRHATGVEKNSVKQFSLRPRAAKILSCRQPSCVEELQVEERPGRQHVGRTREFRSKTGGGGRGAASLSSAGRSSTLLSSRTQEHHNGGSIKVESDGHKHISSVGPPRANGKTGMSSGMRAAGKTRMKDDLSKMDAGLRDKTVTLTSEQLQRILNTVQTCKNGQQPPDEQRVQENQTGGKSGSSVNEGGDGGETKEEDRGGGEMKEGGGDGGETGTSGSAQDKDKRSGCLFSWLQEQQSDSRSAVDAKKAQWKRELDQQVALKQQCSGSNRLQVEDDRTSVSSSLSSVGLRETHAAVRSSLKLGEVTPVEEVLDVQKKEEQRRRWLEELDRQREEATERRRREKLLQRQTEDHELWASHFDSLQRRPLHAAVPAPPSAPSCGSERGDWEPSSSLSLVWEATSSCGAESVGGASVRGASMETAAGFTSRASHLRTMTALLDPVQVEERERRRLKQLEQQHAIEAQVEERRRLREQEEAKRREEEEEEEKRVMLEREKIQRQYELDTLRERRKVEQSNKDHNDDDGDKVQETLEPSVSTHSEHEGEEKEVSRSESEYKDTAVQTETLQTDVSVQQPPPAAAPSNSSSRAARTGKENICHPPEGGGAEDPYEAFARTDRSKKDKKRPEWNTQRPSRRFVPASQRYPAALQRNRQESRLKRQAELLALQERTRQSRTDAPHPIAPPAGPPPSQHLDPHLCSDPPQTRTSPNSKVETLSREQSVSNERGRSPPIPAVRHRVQSQQVSNLPPPLLDLDFIPYVRTDEVFNLDPLEPADTPPPHTHTHAEPPPPLHISSAPPAPSHRDPLLHRELLHQTPTQRQQEILRGLAQLRQGLLQKQKELETELNPRLKRLDGERHSATQHM